MTGMLMSANIGQRQDSSELDSKHVPNEQNVLQMLRVCHGLKAFHLLTFLNF